MHIKRLARDIALVLRRAYFNAQAATGAILDRRLNRVELIAELAPFRRHRLEAFGSTGKKRLISYLGANRRVRTHGHALAALDAQIRFPNRNFKRDIALLPTSRADGIGSVHGKSTNRKAVPFACDDRSCDLMNKFWRAERHDRRKVKGAGYRCCHIDLMKVLERRVYGFVVLSQHRLAAFAVSFLYRLLDFLNRFLARQNIADREEARLHNRVYANAHPGLPGNLIGVNDVEFEILFDDFLLNRAR